MNKNTKVELVNNLRDIADELEENNKENQANYVREAADIIQEPEIITGILLRTEEAVLGGETIVVNFNNLVDAEKWFKTEKEKIKEEMFNVAAGEDIDEYVREEDTHTYVVDLDSVAFVLRLCDGRFNKVMVSGF